MPALGLVGSDNDDDDGREGAYRDGWRDVKILWAVLVVVLLIAVL